MRGVVLRVVFAVTLASGLPGCIPDRDNPSDPINAPAAVLFITTGTNGAAAEGNRNTSFRLDASGSSDVDGADLRFSWDLDGDGVFEVPESSSPTLVTTLPIDTDLLPASGVGSAPRTVTVQVHAGSRTARAQAVAILSNLAPIVDVGGDLDVPRLTEGTVVLDPCGGGAFGCTSSEPDGDAVTWTWRQVRGDAVVLTSSGLPAGVRSFTAPREDQDLVFEASASDGLAVARTLMHVRVGSIVWAQTEEPAAVYRVSSDYATTRFTGGARVTTLAAARSGEVFYAISPVSGPQSFVSLTMPATLVRLSPSLDVITQTVPFGNGPIGSIAPVENGDLCLAWFGGIARIRTDGTIVHAVGVPASPQHVFSDDAGGCWGVGVSGEAWRYGPDMAGTQVQAMNFPGTVLMTVDPADGALWESTQGGDIGTLLMHVTEDGAVTQLAPASESYDAMVPARGGGIWLHRQDGRFQRATLDQGAIVLDPPTQLAVTLPPADIRLRLPGNPTRRAVVSDPELGFLFAADTAVGGIDVLRDHGDGTLSFVTVVAAQEMMQAAADIVSAARWDELAIDLRRGRILGIGFGNDALGDAVGTVTAVPTDGRRAERLPITVPGSGYLATDWTRGAAWIARRLDVIDYQSSSSSLFQRVDANGRLLAQGFSPGNFQGIATQPDGTAWIAHTGSPIGISRIDATGALVGTTYEIAGFPSGSGVEVPGFLAGLESRGSLCLQTWYRSLFSSSNGVIYRLEVGNGAITSATPLGSEAGDDYGIVTQAQDGACWSISPGAGVSCAPVAAPAFVSTGAGGVYFSTPTGLAADPLDASVWVADGDRVVHLSPTGADLGVRSTAPLQPTAIALEHVCDDAAEESCAEIWFAAGGEIRRIKTDGTVRDGLSVPQGTIRRLSVLPSE